jgi:undecaprenyl diphosphate synthase
MIENNGVELAEESVRLPRHIAIIMDGNGRWAKRQGKPRSAGHAAGAESFRRAARYCRQRGVEYLTVYAFSTENWKRPAAEVAGIMRLLKKYLLEAMEDMEKENTRLCFFGDLSPLTPELRQLCMDCMERSKGYTGGQVNICLNYGGRDEIIRAAKKWAADGCPELTEEKFGSYLWSAGVPDPDLLIRPGGEMRISNYLLWQLAYAEMYFSDVLWPDFDEAEIDRAIEVFQNRDRRFGGV